MAQRIGREKEEKIDFLVKIDGGSTVSISQDKTDTTSKIEVGDVVYIVGAGDSTTIKKAN